MYILKKTETERDDKVPTGPFVSQSLAHGLLSRRDHLSKRNTATLGWLKSDNLAHNDTGPAYAPQIERGTAENNGLTRANGPGASAARVGYSRPDEAFGARARFISM